MSWVVCARLASAFAAEESVLCRWPAAAGREVAAALAARREPSAANQAAGCDVVGDPRSAFPDPSRLPPRDDAMRLATCFSPIQTHRVAAEADGHGAEGSGDLFQPTSPGAPPGGQGVIDDLFQPVFPDPPCPPPVGGVCRACNLSCQPAARQPPFPLSPPGPVNARPSRDNASHALTPHVLRAARGNRAEG